MWKEKRRRRARERFLSQARPAKLGGARENTCSRPQAGGAHAAGPATNPKLPMAYSSSAFPRNLLPRFFAFSPKTVCNTGLTAPHFHNVGWRHVKYSIFKRQILQSFSMHPRKYSYKRIETLSHNYYLHVAYSPTRPAALTVTF